MRKLTIVLVVALMAVPAFADPNKIEVKPIDYDPFKSELVNASWMNGTGCPTNATFFNAYTNTPATYSDPACLIGDPKDKKHEGLLLFKTGLTANWASAAAEIKGVKGMTITELGYDIRKQAPAIVANPAGSHCGAGAPRFNILLESGATIFIGCSSPAGVETAAGIGWTRVRWGTALLESAGVIGPVRAIYILFDEGQDVAPDFFGAAVLDNIDVNGILAGRGANTD